MEFINPVTMIPMQWRYYLSYDIASLDDYFDCLDPTKSKELKELFHRDFNEEFPHAPEDLWPSVLKKDIIFPTPDSAVHTYNPWDDKSKLNSFLDFSNLWKFNVPPPSEHILGWCKEYGLPCETPYSKTLESFWGYSFLGITLPQDRTIARCLQRVLDRTYTDSRYSDNKLRSTQEQQELDKKSDLFYRSRHTMFVSAFITLSKEAYLAELLLKSLMDGKSPKGIDQLLKDLIKQDQCKESEWIDKSTDAIPSIQTWRILRDLVASKTNGVSLSVRAKYAKKFPNVELRYAYKAEDLLAVMWTRFYSDMVALGPRDLCPRCGEVFKKTRSNKVFCSKTCSGYVRQQRNLNKKEELDITRS